MPHVFYDSAEVQEEQFSVKNNLRTIDAQIVPKPKNNEPRPKFTGSYKNSVYVLKVFTT